MLTLLNEYQCADRPACRHVTKITQQRLAEGGNFARAVHFFVTSTSTRVPFLVKVGDWQPRMENFQEYLQIDQCYLNLRKARHIPTHGQMANWIMEVKPGRIDLGEVAASGQRSSLRAAWPIDGRLCLHSIVLLVTNLLILLHFSLPRWLALANWRIDVMNRHEMIGQALFLGIEKGTLLHWWLYHAKLIN